jgi:short-subunit dehydrogenase
MMNGKAVVIHGFKNLILANSIRFAPRSLVVKITVKIQAKKF